MLGMDEALASLAKDLRVAPEPPRQETSVAAQPTSEQRPKLYYSRPEDLMKIVARNGFDPSVAGEDFAPLCAAASRAFAITAPRKVGMIISGDYGCGKTFFVKCLKLTGSQFVALTLACGEHQERVRSKAGHRRRVHLPLPHQGQGADVHHHEPAGARTPRPLRRTGG